MEINDWQSNGNYFIYKDKYRIFYRKEGQGAPLLLLHGFPTASWDWHKVWPELICRFQVLAPDFIGFGFSDKPHSYPYSIKDQADLIEALLSELQIEEAHVMAHDYGDTVLQELLARRIERLQTGEPGLILKSVVLLNGGLFPETHHARPIQKLLISPLGGLLSRLLNKKSLERSFNQIFGPDTKASLKEIDDFFALVDFQNGKRNFHKLIRYMDDRKRYRERWVSALQNSPVPIRLINGSYDPVSGQHMAERYRELIENPDIISLDRIGHYPQTEDPKSVLKYFLSFIDNLSGE